MTGAVYTVSFDSIFFFFWWWTLIPVTYLRLSLSRVCVCVCVCVCVYVYVYAFDTNLQPETFRSGNINHWAHLEPRLELCSVEIIAQLDRIGQPQFLPGWLPSKPWSRSELPDPSKSLTSSFIVTCLPPVRMNRFLLSTFEMILQVHTTLISKLPCKRPMLSPSLFAAVILKYAICSWFCGTKLLCARHQCIE